MVGKSQLFQLFHGRLAHQIIMRIKSGMTVVRDLNVKHVDKGRVNDKTLEAQYFCTVGRVQVHRVVVASVQGGTLEN